MHSTSSATCESSRQSNSLLDTAFAIILVFGSATSVNAQSNSGAQPQSAQPVARFPETKKQLHIQYGQPAKWVEHSSAQPSTSPQVNRTPGKSKAPTSKTSSLAQPPQTRVRSLNAPSQSSPHQPTPKLPLRSGATPTSGSTLGTARRTAIAPSYAEQFRQAVPPGFQFGKPYRNPDLQVSKPRAEATQPAPTSQNQVPQSGSNVDSFVPRLQLTKNRYPGRLAGKARMQTST